MIAPGDERHGTPAGNHAGCKDSCCREARNRYERNRRKRAELGHPSPIVEATGTQRRLRALMALGWPARLIAEHAGIKRGQSGVDSILRRQTVQQATRDRVARTYDDLSMRVGPSPITRARAARKGWLPPLAWDDWRIDDPDYQPNAGSNRRHRDDVDEAVVLRVLSGERLDTTPAERAEVVRRWLASGRSERQLCQITGWRMGRYTEREEVA